MDMLFSDLLNISDSENLQGDGTIEDGFQHENFCTLCGVPFWASYWWGTTLATRFKEDENDQAWISHFLVLRVPGRTDADTNVGPCPEVCISGVGQREDQCPRIPPPSYDMRNILKKKGIVLRGSQEVNIRPWMSDAEAEEWGNFELLYKSNNTEDGFAERHYCMHPRCWDILVQQHALSASPDKAVLDLKMLAKVFTRSPLSHSGGGFNPDWTMDYAGVESFFPRVYGKGPALNFLGEFEWQFLARDPGLALGFDELLARPPIASAANIAPKIKFDDRVCDVFSRLPAEILSEILVLLPSASVRSLQLASRRMASLHLGSRYWRSRFEFPNELCHVSLPSKLLSSGQVGDLHVDWRSLCDQLLHPVGKRYAWWQNRKRIAALNKKLVESLSRRRSDGSLMDVGDVRPPTS